MAASVEQRIANAKIDFLRGHTAKVSSLAWNKDGSILASGGADGNVRLWQLDASGLPRTTQPLRYPFANVDVTGVSWSPDDPNLLVSVGRDLYVRFWDVRTGRAEFALQLPKYGEPTGFMSWHPDGKVLALSTKFDWLILLDARRSSVDGRKVSVLYAQQTKGEINQIAWSPSGLLFITQATSTLPGSHEGTVEVLKPSADFASMAPVARVRAHTGVVYALSFTPDGRRFLTGSVDSNILVWDTEDLAVERVVDRLEFSARSLVVSHDGAYAAVTHDGGTVEIFRISDGARIRSAACSTTTGAAAWHPSKHVLAFGVEERAPQQQYHNLPPDFGAVRVINAAPSV